MELWQLNAAAEQLRRLLNQKVCLFQSALIVANPGEPVREGALLRDLKPERAADAVCTQNAAALAQCLSQTLARSTRRADLWNYLSAVINDSRIAYSLSPARLNQVKAAMDELLVHAVDAESCIQALCGELLALLQEPEGKRSVSEIVEEIVQQMEANYHTAITVEALAKQYNFVPRYLNKVFKDQKGVRPMEYLLAIRIDRARAMLETKPDALVKDVAKSVGYSDPLYFSRIFKRETGLWPSEVQENGE